ncbi:uncharacterized protein LOC117182995 [Belonocnema kinseyi]|uniref:uncharacterized protein LOC117182995 n=1 Tax=Belonocnema kinseyi TaxID=2817044 RepID=UPI00143CE5C1|nr:uncharacterized protein LOC117182995 [Belonocnema kinseyi]
MRLQKKPQSPVQLFQLMNVDVLSLRKLRTLMTTLEKGVSNSTSNQDNSSFQKLSNESPTELLEVGDDNDSVSENSVHNLSICLMECLFLVLLDAELLIFLN